MKIETLRWRNDRLELIDQRLLPHKTRYITCRTAGDVHEAIRKMKVRGAPAIGVAAAFGVYLGVRRSRAENFHSFKKDLARTIKCLASSRPTARNLFWALERMERCAQKNKHLAIKRLKRLILNEARATLTEDTDICRLIGKSGEKLIKKGARVLTHCNAGGLACSSYGTALGVIFAARKKIQRVYADETRPVLQGARLTAWELVRAGIPATLICDNMAASLMRKKEIDTVIVGADRIAANGDTANKIGTYNVAILARHHGIPFYVAAPVSTFDLSIKTGREIPIEERPSREVTRVGRTRITLDGMDVRNPAFDVTPHELITAIITERGIIKKPNTCRIAKLIR